MTEVNAALEFNAEIPDPNLRLTLVQAAWDAGLLPPFDKAAFLRGELWEEYNPEAAYNYRLDTRVRNALLAIDVPGDVLGQLSTVVWDGGMEVQLPGLTPLSTTHAEVGSLP